MIIALNVKPGSKVDRFGIDAAGQLTVKLKAPAQEGKANTYLIDMLARELAIPKSAVRLVSGFTNPHKRLDVDLSAMDYERFLDRVRALSVGPKPSRS